MTSPVFRGRRARRALLGVALTGTLVGGLIAVSASSASAAEIIVQAESYAAQSGAQLEPTADTGGGQNVGYLANGDWLRYDGVDLGPAGTVTFGARLSSDSGTTGTIQIRTGSPTGTVLASIPVASTGGWQTWVTRTATAATHPTGAQTVFATLSSAQAGNFVNINWFSVTSGGTTTPPSSTPPTSTPPTGAGWPAVDPVQQAADTRAFFGLTPRPITGDVVRVPEFNAGCTVSHHLNDDPIIFPGMAGASHPHTFLGNTSTNANSTNASLLGHTLTTCAPAEDLSAYWIPSLFQNGTLIDPAGVTVYYGSRLADPSKTQPFPPGFRMIAGDAKLQVPSSGNQFWCAGPGGQIGRSADGNWPICAPTANLTYQLVFPDCWDGVHLDSPNHKDHVGPTGPDGTCASGRFPVTIPSLSFVIDYPTHGSAAGYTLASGMASSMHGDFMNAWQPAAQAARVRNCIDQSVKCNAAGNN